MNRIIKSRPPRFRNWSGVWQQKDVIMEGVYKLYPEDLEKGTVKIKRHTVTPQKARYDNICQAIDGKPLFYRIKPGDYIVLQMEDAIGSWETMMSDTPMEIRTNAHVVEAARGNVLIAGLGIGLLIHNLLMKPEVSSITVVEQNADLIKLVAPLFPDKRLRVVQGDIFNFMPEKGCKYETIYFDIWPNISGDNVPEIQRLHKQFKKYLAPGGFMDSWVYKECKRMKRKEDKYFLNVRKIEKLMQAIN